MQRPSVQFPSGPMQIRVPIIPGGHAPPRARHGRQVLRMLQSIPDESIVQLAVSVRDPTAPQVPLEHASARQVRLWVPVVAHSAALVQGLQSSQTSDPQSAPSVLREHGSLSELATGSHLPALHSGRMVVTGLDPVSAHGLEYAQSPALRSMGPHSAPFVSRTQPLGSVSVPTTDSHAPSRQTYEVRLLVRSPAVAQGSSYVHSPHDPIDGAPQARPSVSRTQASLSLEVVGSQVPSTHA